MSPDVLKAAIKAQSDEEFQRKTRQRGSSSESESQFNIDTVHNENNYLHDYYPTVIEEGNIKTTNEVNMDDIVLLQITKGINKRMP